MRWKLFVTSGVLAASVGCHASPSDDDRQDPPGTPATHGAPDRAHGEPPDPSVPAPTGTDGWRMSRPATDGQIEAFTTVASGTPGTEVGLKVSTAEPWYRVFAYRIGSYDGGTGTLVWSSSRLPGEQQAAPAFAAYRTRTVVAPWRLSASIDTDGWAPGFYVFRLRSGSGWEQQVPFIVSSPSAAGTVALVAPVTTWQAYNGWGGYSLYEGPPGDRRSWAVSFDRPYRGVGGLNDYHVAVVPLVVRAEALGVPLSYFANVDLHGDDDRLAGARGYVSMGHDEYWTPGMRRAVVAARDAGTNLAFLGANTMYWRIRLDDRRTGPLRLVTGYRHDAHLDPLWDERPEETTARYRDQPAPQPENAVTGILYECYPVDTDYVVVSPQWWGFAGTGVRAGTAVAGLVGGEADRVYPDAATPRPLQVLSHSPYSCRGDATSAQSVYYTAGSGAGVFTAGTLRWVCALADLCDRRLGPQTRDFVRRVTDQLLRGFADGPVGLRHPARDNLERFDLPLLNSVSAS